MYIKTVGYRILAYFIDIIVIAIIGVILNQLIGFGTLDTSENNLSFSMSIYEATLIFTIYFSLLEYLMYGGTLGKKLLKIKVLKDDMKPYDNRNAYLIRGFVKGMLSTITPISFLFVAFTKNKQSIHDLVMKTIVVRKVKESQMINHS